MNPSPSIWPDKAPFALFLSHDIDQIHDREFFRILADLNHIRRLLTQGEKGSVALALKRVARALFFPKSADKDFKTILEIEARYGFTSSFYVLHDPYLSRHGPRYMLKDVALHKIVGIIEQAGGEIGCHGGYYRFNHGTRYKESREKLRLEFGVDIIGIRNHHLRFSFPDTWIAQEFAGFKYDSTFGYSEQLGPRDGQMFPFFPVEPKTGRTMDILVLPLTVMDVTLFRYLGLNGSQALTVAWDAIEKVVLAGGLVSLLWHNNFFNEPEYHEWQWVYEQLLERLAALNPWCATGAEIDAWWRSRKTVSVL